MSERRPPLLLFVPSIFAVLVLAFSWDLERDASEIVSAQIIGGPTDSSEGFRGRLRVVREQRGFLSPLVGEAVQLRAAQGGLDTALDLITDSEGWVEFELPRRPAERLELELLDAHGARLLFGAAELSTGAWASAARRRGLSGEEQGSDRLRAMLGLESGVLAVPFRSRLSVQVRLDGRLLPAAKVEASLRGATFVEGSGGETDEQGLLRLTLRAREHSVVVSLRIEARGETLKIYQNLPVVPGSLSLERKADQWWVQSPVHRDHAWFTLLTPNSRGQGGRVSLHPEAGGTSRGILDLKDLVVPRDGYLLLSSSAEGLSSGTVGIPLSGQVSTFDASDVLLLDSGAAARLRVENRIHRARWVLGIYVAISGFLTLGLLVFYVRAEERRLKEGLERAFASEGLRRKNSQPLMIAVFSLFFAFSLGVLWIVAR